MTSNRSVPATTLLPHLTYGDVGAAIAWLSRAFGFVELYRYGERPDGAQMCLAQAYIMLESRTHSREIPRVAGCSTQYLTVFIDDVDAHYAHAKSAGATIVEELNETAYGERQYGCEDLDGHRWLFSRHVRDVDPRTWGAEPAVSEDRTA